MVTHMEPRLMVVVPAHQAEGEIELCLDALLRAGFAPVEILVVDDGSWDATGACASKKGVRVIRNERTLGAAGARNRGVAESDTEIIVFVDADVIVHPDVRSRIIKHFATEPALTALFGSYDDRPPAPSVVSRYRNLLHHHVHQLSRAETQTFWTGLGAVRRDDFLRLGGFDKAWEKIEDVEFGVRLRRSGGRILLDRGLLGTHLKAWTIGSMFRTDLWGRAIPWSRLVLFHGGPTDDLNLTSAHRLSAAMVALFGIGLLGATLFDGRWLFLCAAVLAGFVMANRRFLGFLARRFGLGFALTAIPYHGLHYLAAGLGYAWVLATEGPGRVLASRRARAT
jgi:GT2 family glycosyltransferase